MSGNWAVPTSRYRSSWLAPRASTCTHPTTPPATSMIWLLSDSRSAWSLRLIFNLYALATRILSHRSNALPQDGESRPYQVRLLQQSKKPPSYSHLPFSSDSPWGRRHHACDRHHGPGPQWLWSRCKQRVQRHKVRRVPIWCGQRPRMWQRIQCPTKGYLCRRELLRGWTNSAIR